MAFADEEKKNNIKLIGRNGTNATYTFPRQTARQEKKSRFFRRMTKLHASSRCVVRISADHRALHPNTHTGRHCFTARSRLGQSCRRRLSSATADFEINLSNNPVALAWLNQLLPTYVTAVRPKEKVGQTTENEYSFFICALNITYNFIHARTQRRAIKF